VSPHAHVKKDILLLEYAAKRRDEISDLKPERRELTVEDARVTSPPPAAGETAAAAVPDLRRPRRRDAVTATARYVK
jgi:hypothetical protein